LDKSSFDKINLFCDRQNISQTERDFIIRKFSEGLFNAIEQKERQKGSPLTARELNDIGEPLLNEINLENIMAAAKTYYASLEDRFLLQFQKNNKSGNFWSSVGVNIVSNVIYSGLLIVIFFVAKDQISGWLNSLK
jgi:hypothetical protein